MTKRIPAIKTEYRGIVFRSKLEAKYARAFDLLGIAWAYEDRNFIFDDWTCYAPDFYMPEVDTYFEVKGVFDCESKHKVESLARIGNRVVVGGADGSMMIFDGTRYGYFAQFGDIDEAILTSCNSCGRAFFVGNGAGWDCVACGEYDGDHHLASWHTNIFDAAYGDSDAVA